MDTREAFEGQSLDPDDPDPWLALYLDRSFPIADTAKAALLADMRSKARNRLLPFVRPLARLSLAAFHVPKAMFPAAISASGFLHASIARWLSRFGSPEANLLILRHFHIGSEILEFIARNMPVEVPTTPLRPRTLDDLRDHLFVKHDLNLFNFIIRLNQEMRKLGSAAKLPNLEDLDFGSISVDGFDIQPTPKGRLNFVDIQTAIEIYTPMYKLLLTDNDFRRANNSLQLDETVGMYTAMLLQNPMHMALVNNKHPMVPLSGLTAGFRLVLHGLASEGLHAILVKYKQAQARGELRAYRAEAGSLPFNPFV